MHASYTALGRFLLQAQQIVSMNRPASRDRMSVQNLMENGFEVNGNHLRPLLKADSEFVYCKEDLVTLRPGRESAWLDYSVERLLDLLRCKLTRVSKINTSSILVNGDANKLSGKYIFCSKVSFPVNSPSRAQSHAVGSQIGAGDAPKDGCERHSILHERARESLGHFDHLFQYHRPARRPRLCAIPSQ